MDYLYLYDILKKIERDRENSITIYWLHYYYYYIFTNKIKTKKYITKHHFFLYLKIAQNKEFI